MRLTQLPAIAPHLRQQAKPRLGPESLEKGQHEKGPRTTSV